MRTSLGALTAPDVCPRIRLSSVSRWDKWSTALPEETSRKTPRTLPISSFYPRSMSSSSTVSHVASTLVSCALAPPLAVLESKAIDTRDILPSSEATSTRMKPLPVLPPSPLATRLSSSSSSEAETEIRTEADSVPTSRWAREKRHWVMRRIESFFVWSGQTWSFWIAVFISDVIPTNDDPYLISSFRSSPNRRRSTKKEWDQRPLAYCFCLSFLQL